MNAYGNPVLEPKTQAVIDARLPRIVPLKLTLLRQPFDHPDWVFELKHDGFRAIAYLSAARRRLVSSRGTIFKTVNPLCEALSKLPVRDAILDGEIVCLDRKGNSLTNELLFRRGMPYFCAFDLLWLNGHDLRSLRFIERKERLTELIKRSGSPSLLCADHVDGYGIDFFRTICKKNLQGIVAKHRASPYSASAKWIKIENPAYGQSQRRHELLKRFTSTVKGGRKAG